MKISVIGLGKIGLPLAAQYAHKGHQVVGVDIDERTVAAINRAEEPFPGEAHLQEHLAHLVPAGTLRATTEYSAAVPDADVIVVVVPLFVDDDARPDYDWMDAATRDVAANLTTGTLVIYETTLPVGTTRTRWKPMLEEGSGLVEGSDFHVVFSPERVLTGRVFEDLRKYPKIIGALSDAGAKAALAFYQDVLDFDDRPDLARGNGVWDVGSAEAAELSKLAETTYRDVNIGLANQFARYADSAGIDVHQVIEAANSQPYSHIHKPGVAVGGHCIPVYPQLYLSNDPGATVVRAAREANESMPNYAVQLLEANYGSLRRAVVAVLGASYRDGVKETAFSGVFPLVEALRKRGARPCVHDPLYTSAELVALGLEPYRLGDPVDAIILHTAHGEYRDLSAEDVPGAKVVVDGRDVLSPSSHVAPTVRSIGRGQTAAPGDRT